MLLQEIRVKINQVKQLINANQQSNIRLNANGGNSILIVSPPEQEIDFINEMFKEFDETNYMIINLNQLLISFIEEHRDDIELKFELLKSSPHQIFKSPEGEMDDDFFNYILKSIKESYHQSKIPVLVNVGALYGTGIENIHIMESNVVLRSKVPLVILYPATNVGGKLMFLGFRVASKYRCMIIN